MRLIITTEYHFRRGRDGVIRANGTRGYAFWERYLDVFGSVVVVARVSDQEGATDVAVEGRGVSIAALPGYTGPRQYLERLWTLRRTIRRRQLAGSAVILRSGTISSLVWGELRSISHPYGIEVVGDPYDVFAPGVVKHPMRPALRWWFSRQLRRQSAGACAAAYVTESALQRRYPTRAWSVSISDVNLKEEAFVEKARSRRSERSAVTLVYVGSLAQLYKGPDILIDAVARSVARGLELRLILVGDGKYRQVLEAGTATLGLEGRVRFLGELPAGDPVREQLDEADIFVLPSRTEGLPRAMIEAMARGLPCIGSTVGGIPELLPPEDMVPPGDIAALAAKIREIATNPDRMARMSARSLAKAKEYREEVLRERRVAFYRYVRAKTEEWLRSRNG